MSGRSETSSSFWHAKEAIAKTFANRKPPINSVTRDSLCKITRGLYLSSCHLEVQKSVLQDHGVTHILQVGQELSPTYPGVFKYKHVPVYDLEGEDLVTHFQDCFAFINEGREAGAVLVHCAAGISRSASVVIAYLMAHGGLSLQDARSAVKAARPAINPNQGFSLQLQLFQEAGCTVQGWEPWNLERFLQVRAETYSRRASGGNGAGRSTDGCDDSSLDASGTLRGACEVTPPTLNHEESGSPVSSPSHTQAARQRVMHSSGGVDSCFTRGGSWADGSKMDQGSSVRMGDGNIAGKKAEMGGGNECSSGESAGFTSPMSTALGATGVTWSAPSVSAHLALPSPEGTAPPSGHLLPVPYASYPYPYVHLSTDLPPSSSSMIRAYHRQHSADATAGLYAVPVAASGFVPSPAAVATFGVVLDDTGTAAPPPPQSPATSNGAARTSVTSLPDLPARPHTTSGATTEVSAAAVWARSQALMHLQPVHGNAGPSLAPAGGMMATTGEAGHQHHGSDAGGRLAAHASTSVLHGIMRSGGSAKSLRVGDGGTLLADGSWGGRVPDAARVSAPSSGVIEAEGPQGGTSELYGMWSSAATTAPGGRVLTYAGGAATGRPPGRPLAHYITTTAQHSKAPFGVDSSATQPGFAISATTSPAPTLPSHRRLSHPPALVHSHPQHWPQEPLVWVDSDETTPPPPRSSDQQMARAAAVASRDPVISGSPRVSADGCGGTTGLCTAAAVSWKDAVKGGPSGRWQRPVGEGAVGTGSDGSNGDGGNHRSDTSNGGSSGNGRNGAGWGNGGSSMGRTASGDAPSLNRPGEDSLVVRAPTQQPILTPAGLERTPSKPRGEEGDTGPSYTGDVAATADRAADADTEGLAPYRLNMMCLPLNIDNDGGGEEGDGLEPPLLLPASPQGNGAAGGYAASALLGHIRADAEITSSRTGSLGGAGIQVVACDEEPLPLPLPQPQHDGPMGHMLRSAAAGDSTNAPLATAAFSHAAVTALRSSRLTKATFAHRPSLDGADPDAAATFQAAPTHGSSDRLGGAVPLPLQSTPRPQLLPPVATTLLATADDGDTGAYNYPRQLPHSVTARQPCPADVYPYDSEEDATEGYSTARASMTFSLPSRLPSMSAIGPTVPVVTAAAATAAGVEERQPQVQRQPHTDVLVAAAGASGASANSGPGGPTERPMTLNAMRARLSMCSRQETQGSGEGGGGTPLAQRVQRSITSLLTRAPQNPTPPIVAPDAAPTTTGGTAKQAAVAAEGSAESSTAIVAGRLRTNRAAECAAEKPGGNTTMAAAPRQGMWSVGADFILAAGSAVWSLAGAAIQGSSGLHPPAGSGSSSSTGGIRGGSGLGRLGRGSIRATVLRSPVHSTSAPGGPTAPGNLPNATPSTRNRNTTPTAHDATTASAPIVKSATISCRPSEQHAAAGIPHGRFMSRSRSASPTCAAASTTGSDSPCGGGGGGGGGDGVGNGGSASVRAADAGHFVGSDTPTASPTAVFHSQPSSAVWNACALAAAAAMATPSGSSTTGQEAAAAVGPLMASCSGPGVETAMTQPVAARHNTVAGGPMGRSHVVQEEGNPVADLDVSPCAAFGWDVSEPNPNRQALGELAGCEVGNEHSVVERKDTDILDGELIEPSAGGGSGGGGEPVPPRWRGLRHFPWDGGGVAATVTEPGSAGAGGMRARGKGCHNSSSAGNDSGSSSGIFTPAVTLAADPWDELGAVASAAVLPPAPSAERDPQGDRRSSATHCTISSADNSIDVHGAPGFNGQQPLS